MAAGVCAKKDGHAQTNDRTKERKNGQTKERRGLERIPLQSLYTVKTGGSRRDALVVVS